MCARNSVKLVKKGDVKECTTQCACFFYWSFERNDGVVGSTLFEKYFMLVTHCLNELPHSFDTASLRKGQRMRRKGCIHLDCFVPVDISCRDILFLSSIMERDDTVPALV